MGDQLPNVKHWFNEGRIREYFWWFGQLD